jgi:hypothetical protein
MHAPDCHGHVTRWDPETLRLLESRRSGAPLPPPDTSDRRRSHTFVCPRIAMTSVSDSRFEGRPGGYASWPSRKEQLPDGRIKLFCEAQVWNPSFSVRLSDGYDLTSCNKRGSSWACAAPKEALYGCPVGRARDASTLGFVPEVGTTFTSMPSNMNLQPTGDLILECVTRVDMLAMSLTVDADHDFNSCTFVGNDWRCALR